MNKSCVDKGSFSGREYLRPDLSEQEFLRFRKLVYEKTGIHLAVNKKDLLKARLTKLLNRGHFSSFGNYYEHVISDETGLELLQLLDAITTNVTYFFREESHFLFLSRELLPGIIAKIYERKRPPKIHIWSAGCSTGEEPYSLCIQLMESIPAQTTVDFEILATDISSKVLETAQRGVYPCSRADKLQNALKKRYFLKGQGPWDGFIRVKPETRRKIRFQRHNLMDPPPELDKFDAIFCRNVMIYFDRAHQRRATVHLTDALRRGGYLFVGHAETLHGLETRLNYVQPSVYRKP